MPVPHQSVVEKQYNSILIEAGGTLTCDKPNAGLVLRCKGDCTIQGTIDQSGKAPKTNPDNNYDYPEELVCGKGGNGGNSRSLNAAGGTGMPGRPYGGGWGAGGAGGGASGSSRKPGAGGSTTEVTVETADEDLWIGGIGTSNTAGRPGVNGGGGSGAGDGARAGNGGTGAGATGGGGITSSNDGGGSGGGAGNYGGGIILLYVGGNLQLEGTMSCVGLQGGNGGTSSNQTAAMGSPGSGGGGGGGGAIYIVHNGTVSNSANLNVNGGQAGAGGYAPLGSSPSGVAGGLGSITIKQYEQGMTK